MIAPKPLPLIVSTGDPAGVGPEVSVMAAQAHPGPCVLVGDGAWLLADARRRGFEANEWTLGQPVSGIGVLHVMSWSRQVMTTRMPTAEGGAAQILALEKAFDLVQEGHGRALVTAPTSKEAVTLSGQLFTGQTEHLANRAGLARDGVTMLFIGPCLRVALVTTHLSVRDAAKAITEAKVKRSVTHLREALNVLGFSSPKVVVTGLNPHAGEAGLFGNEEQAVITPALLGMGVSGPMAAEAALRYTRDGRFDGAVCMLHDQATIASKLLDWGQAVNVTWGLPLVRTSVDHGTAYDVAGTGKADFSGMSAALDLALRLTLVSSL